MKKNLARLALALALLGILSPAYSSSFDDWALDPYSAVPGILNQFDSGPSTNTGSSTISIAFSNAVFGPGTPDGVFNSGCVGLCSNFYYTVPFNLTISSPNVSIIAGHDYLIEFNVDANDLQSTADYLINYPEETLRYRAACCDPTEYTVLAMNTGNVYLPNVSINFVPSIAGEIVFDINLQSGREVNGGASSGVNPFTENGFYQYSGLSITDLSAPVPLPGAMPLFAAGLLPLGLLGWLRKRKSALRVAA